LNKEEKDKKKDILYAALVESW